MILPIVGGGKTRLRHRIAADLCRFSGDRRQELPIRRLLGQTARTAAGGWLVAACSAERPPPLGSARDAALAAGDATVAAEAGADAGPFERPDSPRLPGADHEIVLPFLGDGQSLRLTAEAALGLLDVHLSVDTTGSFGEEIDQMQATLDGTILPQLENEVPDVAFGVSRFEDFPQDPFGSESDAPYALLTAMTTSRSRIRAAVAALDDPLGQGGDIPESGFEALFQIAVGDGYRTGGTRLIPPFSGGGAAGQLGGVGFRDGAFRTVVHVTDAPSHSPADYGAIFPGTRGLNDVVGAAQAIDLRIIGVASGEAARSELEALALGSGAHAPAGPGGCRTGVAGTLRSPVGDRCPLVFDIADDGSGLSEAIVDAIVDLLSTVVFREVFAEADRNRLGFLTSLEATEATTEPGTDIPVSVDLRPRDGTLDTFLEVRPGTQLTFTATFRNTSVPPADYDQVFRIEVSLFGDALLLRRDIVRIIVPAVVPSDAGADGDAGPTLDGSLDGGVGDSGLI